MRPEGAQKDHLGSADISLCPYCVKPALLSSDMGQLYVKIWHFIFLPPGS